MVQPPPLKKKSLTLDDDWLVNPVPDVVDVMFPLPSTPWMIGPDVVAVVVPPRTGRGHVSPETVVEGDPLVVVTILIPVARPLNS
jgi:hypothetical protein